MAGCYLRILISADFRFSKKRNIGAYERRRRCSTFLTAGPETRGWRGCSICECKGDQGTTGRPLICSRSFKSMDSRSSGSTSISQPAISSLVAP